MRGSTSTTIRLPPDFTSCAAYLSALHDFIRRHRWLYSLHIYDILPSDLFSTLWPAEWRFLLSEDEDMQPLLELAMGGGDVPNHWPDSLREYVRACLSLQLPRHVRVEEFGFDDADGFEQSWDMKIGEGETTKAAMTRKKLHEVERLTRVVFQTATTSTVDEMIDVGAGQGYLTHRLAERWPVVALDFNELQTRGSVSRGEFLQRQEELVQFRETRKGKGKRRGKEGSGDDDNGTVVGLNVPKSNPIRHVTEMIDTERLGELVERLAADDKRRFLLVGLHACGDLSASTMLHTFVTCPSVRAVVVVPCCYNLLSEADDPDTSDVDHGFPLSNHLKTLAGKDPKLVLTHRGRNLACQTTSRHTLPDLLAALEGTHRRALADAIHTHLRGSSKADSGKVRFRASRIAKSGGIEGYLEAFMDPLGVKRDEWMPLIASFPDSERKVSVFWLVRSLIAPVVESLLLVDRVVYLEEMCGSLNGGDGGGSVSIRLLNLFEFNESPRNFVLTACKN